MCYYKTIHSTFSGSTKFPWKYIQLETSVKTTIGFMTLVMNYNNIFVVVKRITINILVKVYKPTVI
jgi:hypothetical protein